jgi:hypothetical protein
LRSSSRTIFGIAKKIGSHFDACHGLLIRMPITKTTKSPSISAVTRLSMTGAMAMSLLVEGTHHSTCRHDMYRGHRAARARLAHGDRAKVQRASGFS